MELNFVREDIPKISRAGGSGREAEPWESHLAPLKDNHGESFRVWTYEKRSSAVSRMSSVRDRLNKAVPTENWQLAVRVVPGTDPEQFGVYVAYMGNYTPEQVVENARKHTERSERVRASRAASSSATQTSAEAESPNGASDSAEATEPTAKEKVAAARTARAR